MMKILSTLPLLFISLSILSQVTYVPDDNFEQALIDLGYDTGALDDYVPTANINTITDLNLWNKNIADLTGIENFTALETLDCSLNQLTDLDIAQNITLSSLNCSRNQLTVLNVAQNANLSSLVCHNNQLSSLNLTQNTALASLICLGNQLTNLDLSQNTALVFLDCSDNQLTGLNMSNGNNSNFPPSIIPFSTFNTVNNPGLICIEVDDAAWSAENWPSIDATSAFSEDCPTTTYVPDDNFEQALIDLGYDTGVLDDYVPTANISAITTINLWNKSIADLTGIEDFVALETLDCSLNQLTDLDITQNITLATLNCSRNQLTALDVAQNANLSSLVCHNNQLSSLNLTQNTALASLICLGNQLTNLDLSQNTALAFLDCSDNQLTGLNVSNGNNSNFPPSIIPFSTFNTVNNPGLVCIEVDDAAWSTENWPSIDATSAFSEDCPTYVPDDNFEQALIDLGYDTGALDDYVPTANINTITHLNLWNKNIADLTGIEDFAALKVLNCGYNAISYLDVTHNTALTALLCQDNELTDLDVTQLMALTRLHCNGNQLTNIDVSQNAALAYLACGNNQLTTIDVTQNTALKALNCAGNQLTSLDVTQNTGLNSLVYANNQLTDIDLSQNPDLLILFSNNNQLTNLDLSQNTALVFLIASNNQLTSLNIKNGNNSNFMLPFFFNTFNTVNNPDLSCIEVDDAAWSTANWTSIDATSSFSEDCSPEPSLTYVPDDTFEQNLIDLGYDTGALDDYVPTANINSITTLSIPNIGSIGSPPGISDLTGIEDFTALEVLNCSANALSSLDLSQNVNLTELFCAGNPLTDLNVTQNVNLLILRCNNNSLTNLNVSQNTALEMLDCRDNQLTSLDVTQNSNLKELDCSGNELTDLLTQNANLERLNCNNNQLVSLDITSNTALETLNCRNNLLTSLDVTQNIALTFLFCQTNQLTSLDVSQNTALTSLGCAINQLTSLDITQNTALSNVGCAINQLGELDVTQNTALSTLNTQDNQLTSLDVSQNMVLRILSCEKNLLTDLNVKNGNNTNFLHFNASDNPNLGCIKVDDAAWSTANWTNIDAAADFDENCMGVVPDDNVALGLRDINTGTTTDPETYPPTANTFTNSMWHENRASGLNLFPNPTTAAFTIKGLQEISQVEIYNLNGSLILQQTNYTGVPIDVSKLAAAVYLVRISNPGGTTVWRLIKE